MGGLLPKMYRLPLDLALYFTYIPAEDSLDAARFEMRHPKALNAEQRCAPLPMNALPDEHRRNRNAACRPREGAI